MRTITCLCLIITQQQSKTTHVAAHYVFMPWQKIVCETLHKLHIHIGKMALSSPKSLVIWVAKWPENEQGLSLRCKRTLILCHGAITGMGWTAVALGAGMV